MYSGKISLYKYYLNMKCSGYLPWGQTRTSMTSSMTLYSMSPVRNPKSPPSTHIKGPPFLTHFSERYKHKTLSVPIFFWLKNEYQ